MQIQRTNIRSVFISFKSVVEVGRVCALFRHFFSPTRYDIVAFLLTSSTILKVLWEN